MPSGMKKTTKKLTLHRETIANLTSPVLEHIVGGGGILYFDHNVALPHSPVAVQSVKVTTKMEPCQ
jgi:hypothetical protein